MEKNLEKSLKRFLKRKVKITTAFIVAFLLGSLSTYGKIIAEFDDTSQTVKFYRNGVEVTEEILKSGSITGNATDGFIWNIDKSILEQIEIAGSLTNNGKKFTLKNNGKILGENEVGDWVGNGIVSQITGKVENNGIIAGINNNGFVVGYNIGLSKIDNNGIISGNKSKNGIYFDRGAHIDDNLNNSGTIKGDANGILSQYANIITKLENTGLIRGNLYGISLGEYYCGITNLNNYGVIGGGENSVTGNVTNKNNYGLFVKGSGENVILVESGEKTSVQNGKTIINGVTDDKSVLSSLGVSDLKVTDNLIINVAGNRNAGGEIINSFNVNNENLTLTNSSINGYENAVSLSNGTLTLNGTTVNAGENAVTGSAGDETLNLEANSIINGNIDLGTGQDTISVNSSIVNGNIFLNGGSLNIADTAKINGNINFGDAEGKIIVGEKFSANNFTGKITGNLTNGILGTNYVIYDDTGVSNLNNQLQIFDGIKTVQLKDGVDNNVNLSDITANHFSEIRGGTGNDSFTVSVDKFEKLSLIDGGADRVKGDSLTISDSNKTFTNIKDGTIDDTVFDKIQNIENLEMGENTLANLNLNNLTSEYLQNLNIKLGNSMDTIYASSDTLRNLKSINGGNGNDILKLTDKITDKNESFEFINKNKVNSFKDIYFSDEGNTINLDNLAKANDEIEFIYGGSGDDYFITSANLLLNSDPKKQIYGQNGEDTIEITSTVNENDPVFKFVNRIEKLVLSGENNKIIVDKLIKYNGENNFTEITGTNGGTNGNTFTINGTDTDKKDKALEMKIEGGSSANDKLIVNTNITTDQLSNKTGIENLELGLNSANPIDYTIDFTKLNDFKNITSGSGNDTFNNVSVGKVAGITGGAGTDTISLNEAVTDNSQINFGNLFAEDKQGIEKLNLSDNGGNKLSFNDTLNIDNIGKINFGTGENNTLTFIKNTNPTEYDLSNKTDIFNGNVAVDLNSNIISTGSSLAGDTIKITDSFIGNGKVTFSNGEIRFNLADNISFADGTATKYNIDFGKLAESKDTVKTYSFLNIDTANGKLTVKSLDNLVNEAGVSLDNISNYTENYEILLKKYNTDSAVKTAFNNWTAGELVNASKDMIQDLGAYTFDNNSREYQGITSSKALTIDTDTGNKINDMTFNAVAGERLTIINYLDEGNGKIIFNGTTSFANGIYGIHFSKAVHLDFNNTENNGVTIGDILLGEGENSISIADVSKFDIKKENSDGTTSLGSISAEGTVNVILEKLDKDSTKFNNILANAEKGKNNSVEVTENNKTDIKLTTNYTKGELAFTGTGNTVNLNKDNLAEYTGTVNLGENTFNINGSAMSGNIIGGKGNISVTDNGTWNVKENTKVSQAGLENGNINIAENVKLDNTVFIENGKNNITGNGTVKDVTIKNGKISLGENTKVDVLNFANDGTGALVIGENFKSGNITAVAGTGNLDIDYNVKEISNFAEQVSSFENSIAVLTQNGNTVNLTGVKLSEIISGDGADTFIMNNADGLNIKVTDNRTDNNDTLKLGFIVNNNSFDNISGIENLELSDNGNSLDITKINGFTSITGGKGSDIFTTSADKLSVNLAGGEGEDTLKFAEGSQFDNTANKGILANVSGMEKLELSNADNKVDIDKLGGFTNITGGTGTDIFKSTSSGLNGKTLVGGEGQDSLEMQGSFNNTTANPFTKAEGIENLKFADAENKVDIDKLEGFTNITGGTGTDIFKSTSSGLNGKTLVGGEGQDSLEMKDSFDNTTVNPFTKVDGIENLKLADVTGNIVNVDKLTDFTTITGGNQGDSFTIGNSAKLGITINGGTGTDSLTLETVVDTSKDLKNISGIEKLTFNAEGNKLSFADTDKNNFTSLSFGNNSTGNAVALNNLNEKEIIFGNSSGNTVTIADSSNKFNHKITGAEKIELAEGNSKWTFADGSLITGNTELNLNGNNLDFTDSQGKGNVGLVGTNLKINDVSFVGADSRVTVSNGTIKIGFDNTVTFKDGVNTEFKLSSDGKIGFGDKLTFETYSFINKIGNDLKVTVKKWEDYFTDKNDDRLVYAGRYDEALKKYNTSGNEALTNAFNIFGKDTIVDYIVDNANPKLLYYSDKGSYEVLVAEKGEDILIKTSDIEADKNTKLTFSNISSTGKITIGVTEGNNEITFGSGEDSSVSIKGENGIDFSSSTTDLTVNIAGEKINEVSKIVGNDRDNIINLSGNQISIDKIELGTGENTVKISDISNITKLGSITAKAQGKNILEITNAIEKSESGKLISLLNSGIKGISKVELGDGNDISVNSKYGYSGKVNLNSNNKVEALNGGVLKSLNFAGDNNIVTLNGGSAEGDLTFAGNNNQTVLNSGTLTGTLDFGKGTGNIFTVNTGNEFNYKVKDADTISLNSSKEWTFGNGAKISGDTKIDLNGNTALLSTTSNGTTVTLNRDFAEGNVTFSNGTIKITLNQNTDFSNGVNTKLTLADGGLTGDAKLQTYAFLNVNADKTINVIDWKTLSGDETVTDTHKIIYNNTIKKFNEDEIYGVLTVWEKDSIVSWIKDKHGEVLEDHTVESNKGDYNGIVSSGTITIDTDKGGKLEELDIKDLSSKDVVIGNNTTEGDGKVEFTGNTAVSGTVTNNSKEDVDIIFGGKTEIGKIDSSSSEGTTDIIINNSGDKFVSGDIIFNDKEFNDKNNKLDIEDSSNIDKIGTITGNVDIIIDNVGDKSDGFNNVLAGADKGYNDKKDNNSITVNNSANVNIINKYDGTLTFNGQENNITVGNSIGTLITGAGKDNITLESNVGSLNTGSNDDIINLNVNKFADKVIEVNLDGGDGNDIFNIISLKTKKSANENSDKQPEKSLTGTINSLETINLNTDIGFASDLKITGTNEIKLNGNNLFVNVDYTKKADDKVIGHALYDNGIKVDNSTGKVMIDTAKANDGTIISLGTAGNKTEFASTDKEHLLESGSSNHHIEMIDGDIVVKVNEHIMGDSETGAVKYAHLDKVYQSIVSADKIKEMSDTTTLSDKTKDEAVKAQLEFYGKIYHSTPYAYSNDVSKKSADLITESIMNLKVMPEYKHWVFGGSIAGREADSDSNFYGSNHYNGIDIGKNEVSADTNIYGAYAFGKYGIGINQSVGFAVAGTRSDTNISGNSKLEGDGIYVSAFAEQEINNLKFLAGISYQHSFYDSTRNVSNDYQRMSVDKKYEDDLVSIFAGGKYSYHLGNNFFAEPNVKLSVTHIMQDSIDEGDNGGLTIETDKKDFTFVEGEVGIDLVKKINLSKGTLNLRAGTSLVYLLDGYQEEYLTGRITGSSKSFEMISPEDDRTKVKFTVGTEYEMTNGMFMNLHGNYTTSSHTEDYAVSFGAGYKF